MNAPRNAIQALSLAVALVLATGCGGEVSNDAGEEGSAGQALLTPATCETVNDSLICLHFTSHLTTAPEYGIRDELVRLINAVPAGERLNGTFYGLGDTVVGTALANAVKRGVVVRVTFDGSNATWTSTQAARSLVSAYPTRFKFCRQASGTGCISSESHSIAHTKLLTFSSTVAPNGHRYSNVSWVGSYNAVVVGGGANSSNNSVTTYNAPVSYAGYNATLANMWSEKHFTHNDYFDPSIGSTRGYFYDSNARTSHYISPQPLSKGSEGFLFDQFQRVTPGPGCIIRVMHAVVADSLDQTVARLVQLKRGGCYVFFMVDTIGPKTLATLKANHIEVRKSRYSLHDKVVLIDANYDGVHRKLILTGSHNWSSTCTYKNDEVLIRIDSAALFGTHFTGMYGHFLDLWQALNTVVL